MAFCEKCGTKIEEGVKFCPSCGASIAVSEPNPQPVENDYAAKLQELNNTADTTAEFDQNDIQQNKIMAILAYLSWLVIIPLFAAKESKFARFHTNQGLVLFLAEIAWAIAYSILSVVLYSIKLGFIASVLSLVSLLFFIFAILGIINVVNGKAKELPIIGKIRILK